MNPISFCEHWCGPLTRTQQTLVRSHQEAGTFIGVGRDIGGMDRFPLVDHGPYPKIITPDGMLRLASSVGIIPFQSLPIPGLKAVSRHCPSSCFASCGTHSD